MEGMESGTLFFLKKSQFLGKEIIQTFEGSYILFFNFNSSNNKSTKTPGEAFFCYFFKNFCNFPESISSVITEQLFYKLSSSKMSHF